MDKDGKAEIQDICLEAPFAMDGRHTYEIEGKCIYCGELNPNYNSIGLYHSKKCLEISPLSNIDIQGIIAAFEMNGRILSVQATIEGMKVANAERLASGHTSMNYREIDFMRAANNIMMYANTLCAMKRIDPE